MIDTQLELIMEERIDEKKDDSALYLLLPAQYRADRFAHDSTHCSCRDRPLIPQWTESRSFRSLFSKYRNVQERPFQDAEVKRVVCGLSLIIRLWSFGLCSWATDAATLLDQSEPLEALTMDSLEVAKMRVFWLAYRKQFDEAKTVLSQAIADYPDEPLLMRMRSWLQALKESNRAKTARIS